MRACWGYGLHKSLWKVKGTVLGKPAREGESPVPENQTQAAGSFYGNFSLDMGRSPGFGSTLADYFALLRLGFPPAPDLRSLTLPASVTRRTVLQKVRGPSYIDVPQLVNTGFQVLFHSPPGVLFTFPSQYYALSVTK